MGFEEAPGPIPSRQDELKMIKRLQESWLKQPYYKYYMNEDLRIPKLKFSDRLNHARSNFFANTILFGVLFSPLLIISRRFFIFGNPGLPKYLTPNYFNKERTNLEVRHLHHTLISIAAWLGLSALAANVSTDIFTSMGDQGYRISAKPEKML